jgi:hypothetical protein
MKALKTKIQPSTNSSGTSSGKTVRIARGECLTCKKPGPHNFFCKCLSLNDSTLQMTIGQIEKKYKISPIDLSTTKVNKNKRAFVHLTPQQILDKKKKCTERAQKRRKMEYAERLKNAVGPFNKWLKVELKVNAKYENERVGRQHLENEYFKWCDTKKVSVIHRFTTKSKALTGMHFTTAVLEHIQSKLDRTTAGKNKVAKLMDNGAWIPCIPFISHASINPK